MRFYKKEIYQDNEFGKVIPSVNKLAEILQVSQPYMHKVMTNQTIISEKQYVRFKKTLEKFQKSANTILEK
jgi:hypothetical protein